MLHFVRSWFFCGVASVSVPANWTEFLLLALSVWAFGFLVGLVFSALKRLLDHI